MTASREEMQRMLESVRRVIRQRTVDPATHGDAAAARETLRDKPPAPAKPANTALNAKDNQREFVEHYYRLISRFAEDRTKYELELPNLTGFDRLVVHALAERCNLAHQSSGDGAGRVMRLRKDALFFQHPEAVRAVDLDDVIARVGGKESKFHLRHVRRPDPAELAPGALGSYADEDAPHKIARLRRATDEYLHATEMGYTQEELNTTSDTSLEERLRCPAPDAAAPAPTPLLAPPTPSPTAPELETMYDEVCRGCDSRVRVDYAVRDWSCSKYCATCRRQTIWALERVSDAAPRHDAEGDGVHAMASKRVRDDAAVEEIDVGDEPITVEDAVEMAAMNDFDMEDINWVRRFASLHASRLAEHLVFCIDFDDLKELHIFLRPETIAETATRSRPRNEEESMTEPAVCYVVATAVSALSLSLTALLRIILRDAFAPAVVQPAPLELDRDDDPQPAAEVEDAQDAMEHAALAFRNVSVYGVEATAVCQLRSHVATASRPCMPINVTALEALQRRYGTAHCFVAATLQEALSHLSNSAA